MDKTWLVVGKGVVDLVLGCLAPAQSSANEGSRLPLCPAFDRWGFPEQVVLTKGKCAPHSCSFCSFDILNIAVIGGLLQGPQCQVCRIFHEETGNQSLDYEYGKCSVVPSRLVPLYLCTCRAARKMRECELT